VSKRCYTYPDATIFVDKPRVVNVPEEAFSNPAVVFEVTSPSSEDLDRSRKAELYRGMPSVREYVVVAHDRAYVEHYVRMETNCWLLTELRGLDQTLTLDSVEFEIPFAELYDDVQLEG
jgi:Uma2 family endonuclease